MAFLVSTTQQVFPIPRDRPMIIGRDASCDVTLLDHTCSRQHARIQCQSHSGKILIEDLGSRNGVFVNTLPVRGQRPLQSQDEIKIGSSHFRYLTSLNGELSKLTEAIHTAAGPDVIENRGTARDIPFDVSADGSQLAGSLAMVSIVELLQLLDQTKASGTLVLDLMGDEATIHIRHGAIKAAFYSGVHGMPALFAIVLREQGSFRFSVKEQSIKENINLPNHRVLFELCRVIDETEGG